MEVKYKLPQACTDEREKELAAKPDRPEPSAVAVIHHMTLHRPRTQSSTGDIKSRKTNRPSSEHSAVTADVLYMHPPQARSSTGDLKTQEIVRPHTETQELVEQELTMIANKKQG
jgi:hypothetical protein